jgi:hypothetical protein
VPRLGRAVLLATGLVLGGCSAVAPAPAPAPAPQAQPPAPPAACLLDGAALASATGITWTPDQSTATDTRCVYDPAGSSGPAGFLAVERTSSTDDAATQLDTIAQLCTKGSRADADAADGAFTCRFDGGNVYAARVRGPQVVTISSSAVPKGTTVDRLARGLTEQLRKMAI